MKHLLIIVSLFIASACSAQQFPNLKFRAVHGTVLDENNQPISNCGVSFMGISMGGRTDKDGAFKLNLPNENVFIQVRLTDGKTLYFKIKPEEQSPIIKLDKASTLASVNVYAEWHKNEQYNSDRISQMIQSDEFYKFVHGKSRGADADISIAMPIETAEQRAADIDPNKVYSSVEVLGGLKGEITDWNKYVDANLKYPENAKTDGIKGKIFITFVIEKDGSTSNIKVVRSLRTDCDQAAIQLVRESKWKPNLVHNQLVRTSYTVAVNFNK